MSIFLAMNVSRNTRHHRDADRRRGFTLLELMVAVAVLSILVGLGVPAFNDTIRNNQLAAAGSDLISALTLARSEALKRSIRVSVCAAEDQDNCATGTDWSKGWIVFTDDFGTAGVIEPGDTLLQNWSPPARDVRITATFDRAVSFTPRARAQSAQKFTVTKAGCSGNQQRLIDINSAGRIALERQECAGPESAS